MKLIILLVFSLLIQGCNTPEQGYFVLIGQRSVPEYDLLTVGDRVGGSKSVRVFSKKPVGELIIEWNREGELLYNSAGAIFAAGSGLFNLRGYLAEDSYLYIIHGSRDFSEGVIVHKEKLLAGDVNRSFRLDKK